MPDLEITPSSDPDSAAADWLARLDAEPSASVRSEFERWLGQDPRHLQAWRQLQGAWEIFDRPRLRGESTHLVAALGVRQRRRRTRVAAQGAAAICAAAAAWIISLQFPFGDTAPSRLEAASATIAYVVPERTTLPDGSLVEYPKGARFDVAFSTAERRVDLRAGQAHFAVSRDPGRPFIVSAGPSETRAVGTEFTVKLDASRIDVLVTEGKVAVSPSEPGARGRTVLVATGHRVELTGVSERTPRVGEPTAVSAAEIEQRQAWRAPRLELSSAPLAEVVAAFNRHSHSRIRIDDPSLAQWPLSGVFRADRAEAFLQILEEAYRLRVTRNRDGSVVLGGSP